MYLSLDDFFKNLSGKYRRVLSATPWSWPVTFNGLPTSNCSTKLRCNASAVLTQGGVGREVSFELSYWYLFNRLYKKDHFYCWQLCSDAFWKFRDSWIQACTFFLRPSINQIVQHYYTGNLSYTTSTASQDGHTA